RHRKTGRTLSRTSSHRMALRRAMANSLFTHERIVTTAAKAKEVRRFVERIITLAREGVQKKETDHARYLHCYRQVLSELQSPQVVQKLFGEGPWRTKGGSLAARYVGRNGGYTRLLKLSGSRLGVITGSSVSEIPSLEYKMTGAKPGETAERKLRLIGSRLGDNAPCVVLELVEKGKPEEAKDVKPRVVLDAPKAAAPAEPQAPEPPKEEKKEAQTAEPPKN
ncbi:MAG: 50S ribosomal protein L17, partial [Planctomycetes bacterium]|nr:50S ribosomal protein L17 [Planctomycetota bacterium]